MSTQSTETVRTLGSMIDEKEYYEVRDLMLDTVANSEKHQGMHPGMVYVYMFMCGTAALLGGGVAKQNLIDIVNDYSEDDEPMN